MTTVINLFGGSGCGKSTTAALLFARMKLMGLHIELVREYVKYWAWNDRKVREWDQLYLLGKQSAYESMLYGKVDYIVTDSPILLAGIYQQFRSKGKDTYVGDAAKAFMAHAQQNGVTHRNYFLSRNKPFDPRGRWETEEEAKEIDRFVLSYLESYKGETPVKISGPNDQRDFEILKTLTL
jgi:ABC-type oligopeptide transport system ATPase subunit